MRNLILNICSLVVTAFLLVFLVFGWYVSNTEVSANGILGSTAGEDYEITLEEYVYDGKGYTWRECKNIAFDGIEPNDKFFFRLNVKSKTGKDISLNVSFNELTSKVLDNKISVSGDNIVNNKTNLPIYKIVDNKVTVNEDIAGVPTPKVLYDIIDNSIMLNAYKMHEAFKVYDLKEVEPTNLELTGDGINLSEGAGFSITASEALRHYYFALEFNEGLSNKNVNGYISSNMYLYQGMKIGRISLVK